MAAHTLSASERVGRREPAGERPPRRRGLIPVTPAACPPFSKGRRVGPQSPVRVTPFSAWRRGQGDEAPSPLRLPALSRLRLSAQFSVPKPLQVLAVLCSLAPLREPARSAPAFVRSCPWRPRPRSGILHGSQKPSGSRFSGHTQNCETKPKRLTPPRCRGAAPLHHQAERGCARSQRRGCSPLSRGRGVGAATAAPGERSPCETKPMRARAPDWRALGARGPSAPAVPLLPLLDEPARRRRINSPPCDAGRGGWGVEKGVGGMRTTPVPAPGAVPRGRRARGRGGCAGRTPAPWARCGWGSPRGGCGSSAA